MEQTLHRLVDQTTLCKVPGASSGRCRRRSDVNSGRQVRGGSCAACRSSNTCSAAHADGRILAGQSAQGCKESLTCESRRCPDGRGRTFAAVD
eukprot:677858-Hanusia_phi.AAC.2